ncbi:MAG: AAA family ATPase [Hormoscilla sp.]
MTIAISGYQVLAQIYESANSYVYRGIRSQDKQPVILKVLKQDYPTPAELTRYKQEYEITRKLNSDGVIKAYELQKYQNTLVMILEDFGGKSLEKLHQERQFPLSEIMELAIRITSILGEIHGANIIHKDINPANIVFNPRTGELKIIDFGIASILTRENTALKNPKVLEGTLAYISPEQTGRMNRSVDYRSDFYSLGATFYELLTGQVPFETADAMELVHCHIAISPVPPHKINPEIPQAISDIVMKLLGKTAEERYQGAWGIQGDLEAGLTQLMTQGSISEFTLGRQDISDKFQIPQKLYGREGEVETLLDAFERVAETVKAELMMVAGYSGIGKSSLVQELFKPITARRGYFISGKFDQFQRNIPYSAVVAAFEELVRQLLTESEAQLNCWRSKLEGALGENGQVIIDVIPEVELIIGPQPAVQELGPTETQNRFNLVFGKFIRVFCQQHHPFVIFLDDLQWADSATLKLIELIMMDTDSNSLLLLGGYRDNEVSPTHPLMMTIDRLRSEEISINQITLTHLSLSHITQLIADTLQCDRDRVIPLAELVMDKTEGNPFFVNEFLKTLYQEHLLTFDIQQKRWQWNVKEIEAVGITDNVVDLMIGKLQKLPDTTQEVLRLAACVGNQFDLHRLSIVREQPEAQTFQALLPAITEGLVQATSSLESTENSEIDDPMLILNYKFGHDRVQQAAYASIDEDQKKAVHLRIGQLLLENLSPEERTERIFELTDHLNQGLQLITDRSEQVELAELNLQAGQKAKDATAYAAARTYLTAGMEILTENSWVQEYALTLALYKERAEVESLNGNFERSQSLINFTISKVKTALERALIYDMLLFQYTLRAEYEAAIQTGRSALQELGIDLPESDLQRALDVELSLAKANLGDREISSLLHAPEMTIPEQKLGVKLLSNIDPPAYFSNQELYAVIVVKMAQISLKYGHVPESAKAYVTYGIILGSVLGHYQLGYEFGRLAVQLSEKFNNHAQKCGACLVLAGHLNHWVKHIKWAEDIFSDAYQAGLSSGELRHSGYAIEHQLRYLFIKEKLSNICETLCQNSCSLTRRFKINGQLMAS